DERAELVRARLGSADAVRLAKEKLNAVEAELSAVEKNIARTRSEFEARDRRLNDNTRAQQEALREARERHQTVEERKKPAYLSIGRHLAEKGVAPPNATHLLAEAHRRREAVESQLRHKAELALVSSQIDKQELRKFYFSVFSVVVLLVIILPLFFQSPGRREWLPHETEAILSVNMQRLQSDELAKHWEKEKSDEWQTIWAGLVSNAQQTPVLNLTKDALRVTRGLTTDSSGTVREFALVQAKGDVAPVIHSIEKEQGFERRLISGLPIWERENFALARVGPRTLAVGAPAEVQELAQVRLGIQQDLKITGNLFERFQALDQETALRLISSNPPSLARYFNPIFTRELLDSAQVLGLGLTLSNPVKAHVVIRMKSDKAAQDLAKKIRDEPQRWLRIQDSDLLLYAQAPEVTTQDADLELRFVVPENSARLLLQRVAKTTALPTVAGD
ncbi:MAG: hypothetical protein ACXWAV_01375, partial [Chthoniobacterales bacterium]